jgi:bifunctional ADP-heptose synthase (sugar kinase/adenylyltransferase)
MKKLSKVKDHPHLYRDEDTGAILNYDTIGYNQRLKRIEKEKSQKEELDTMKKDIDEIKELLKEFLKK